jgi:hypothetical protein
LSQYLEGEAAKLLDVRQHPDQQSPMKMTYDASPFTNHPLDYNNLFDDDIGKHLGITIWSIANMHPHRLPKSSETVFESTACYLVLHTHPSLRLDMEHQIYYWIGSRSAMDKQACAAMHAVHLKDFIGAVSRSNE